MMYAKFDSSKASAIKSNLMLVPGVLEVTLNGQNNAVYLKVDRDFDAVKARDVLSA